jgi:hypothetical protein
MHAMGTRLTRHFPDRELSDDTELYAETDEDQGRGRSVSTPAVTDPVPTLDALVARASWERRTEGVSETSRRRWSEKGGYRDAPTSEPVMDDDLVLLRAPELHIRLDAAPFAEDEPPRFHPEHEDRHDEAEWKWPTRIVFLTRTLPFAVGLAVFRSVPLAWLTVRGVAYTLRGVARMTARREEKRRAAA